MIINAGAQLDLLDLDDLLLFARLGRALLFEKTKSSVIQYLTNGRFGVRVDLDQIEAGGVGKLQRLREGNHAVILAFRIDQPNLSRANLLVYSEAFLLRGRSALHWTSNGCSPLNKARAPSAETPKPRFWS